MKHTASHKHIKLICISAMLAAPTLAATFLIKIPLAGLPFNLAQSAVGAVIYIVVAKTAGKWLKKAVK